MEEEEAAAKRNHCGLITNLHSLSPSTVQGWVGGIGVRNEGGR